LRGHIIPARCVKIYDGDTAHFVFKYEGEYIRMRFRLIGYNSAEIIGGTEETRQNAKIARDYLANRLLNKNVVLYLGDFDKYGRPLCDVYLIEKNQELKLSNICSIHINKEMVEKGYGKIYTPSK
jgi:endonuclease YncB( thermonuclease family)